MSSDSQAPFGVRLGVDWGQARIGVAACDAEGLLAYPVATVPNDAAALDRLAELATEYAASGFILGLPTDLHGRQGLAARAILEIAGRLAHTSGRQVRVFDERLTTVMAARHLAAAGRDSRARRGVIDQAAAVAIMEQALDWERRTGEPAGRLVPAREET